MASNNPLYIFGAVVVGVVSAAGFIIIENIRRQREQHAMARDLARLDRELTTVQSQVQMLSKLQKERFFHLCSEADAGQPSNKSVWQRMSSRVRKRIERQSTPTSEDVTIITEPESSDNENYEDPCGDDPSETYEQKLTRVDVDLNSTEAGDITDAFNTLNDLIRESREDPELLWRLAKAHYKMGTNSLDKDTKCSHFERGLAACDKALELNPDSGNTHKWYAIVLGSMNDFKGTKDKIQSSYLFKEHLDKALKLTPDDPTLHHLLGRFAYEIAKLTWLERKLAATFFAQPPTGSFEEALTYLHEAQRLNDKDWKENKLLIAKCQIGLKQFKEAVQSLILADTMPNDLNQTIDSEVKVLLQNYNSYR